MTQKTPFLGKYHHRAKEWSRLLGILFGAQSLIQGLGFLSGILIVRRLPTNEYAYYTLATAMLSAMVALADGGVAAGVLARGGRVWKDPQKLGAVVVTGLALRRRFALLSALAAPVLIYFMRHHGASWSVSLLVLACLAPTFFASLSDSLLEVAPKLRQDIVALQRNQILAALARTILTAATVFTLPICALAVLATGISRMWANIRLRTITKKYADMSVPPDPVARQEILAISYRLLPASLYSCVAGQITIWIISIFGSTQAIGQLGGLTGLSQAMAVLNTLCATLMVPRFARLNHDRSLILHRFIVSQAALIGISIAVVTGAYLFGTQILWLLGKRFGGLNHELVLAFAAACIAMISSMTSQLLSARGIVVPPVVLIPFAILTQIILAFLLPLHEVSGALLFGLYTSLAFWLLRLGYFYLNMRRKDALSAS